MKVILECKQDIWKTPELFELVEEYFENSLQTLDFCTALEKCLKRARDSQLLILVALGMFDEESGIEGKKYVKTLEELKKFKAAGKFEAQFSLFKFAVLIFTRICICPVCLSRYEHSIRW